MTMGRLEPWWRRIRRRDFLVEGAAALPAGGVLWMGGCGYYPAGRGPAYEPWNFPDESLPDRLQLVHAGLLAANPHNTQPWWFHVPDDEPDVFELWADMDRTIGAVDPLLREMNVGFGCAIENMVVCGRAIGRPLSVEVDPDPEAADLVARMTLGRSTPVPDELYEAIGTRHTNRSRYADFELDPRIAESLKRDVSTLEGVELSLLTSKQDKRRFGAATVEATRAFIDDDQMLRDSDAWFRHSEEEILEHRDGPTLDAQALSETTTFFAKIGRKVEGRRGARYWLRATQRVHTGPCSAYAVLSTPTLRSRVDAVAAGRAYQRIALRLESMGLSAHPLSQLAEMRDREIQLDAPREFGRRLDELTPEGRHAQQLFRLGYAWEQPDPAPRRPVSWVVLDEGE